MSPLKLAVVGVGALGRHHARILSELDSVELVAVAGHTFARSDWTAAASDAVAAILARWASHGPTTGVLGGLASPGLMTGLAGLGYGLLRAHAPERVPSVLVLDGVGR